MEKTQKISQVFEQLIKDNEEINWRTDIVTAINKSVNIPNGGWLVVRGILQWYINNGYLLRTQNLFEEIYTVSKK